MKIAVTGGNGFIGRSAIDWCRRLGHEAWSFDRAHDNDILDRLDALKDAEVVIHLAGVLGTAELFEDPEAAVCTNVVGALRVLQWCHQNHAGYVGITMPPVFPSVYTATKLCADRLATAWHLARGVPTSRVRAFNAYGPGQRYGPGHPQKILPTFATYAWAGRPLPIWGDGTQTVDLVHADDVGHMLACAASFGDDQVFDAGTGLAITVNQLASFVLKVTGSDAGVGYLPMRAGETPTHIVAAGDGWDQLDWKPSHDWDRIEQAIRSYR